VTGLDSFRAQDGADELASVPIKDQQVVVHRLAVIPVVGRPLLLAMRCIVGGIDVQHDLAGDAVPSPLLQVELDQCSGQPVAGFGVHRILQPREDRPTGQVRLGGQATTDQLEEGVGAQGHPEGTRIVLILVATGDLEDPLADQRLQGVADRAGPPVRKAGSEGTIQPEGGIGRREPPGAPITPELTAIGCWRCVDDAFLVAVAGRYSSLRSRAMGRSGIGMSSTTRIGDDVLAPATLPHRDCFRSPRERWHYLTRRLARGAEILPQKQPSGRYMSATCKETLLHLQKHLLQHERG
jgi:hypothetical protein